MKLPTRLLAAALALAAPAAPAFAADQIGYATSSTNPNTVPVSPQTPLPVTGTFSASTAGAASSSAPTYTPGSQPLSLDLSGNLRVYDSTLAGIAAAPVPAGTNVIGKVGIDQTTPGTTNGTQDAADGATGSAVPAKAQYMGAQSGGNTVGVIQASASAFLNMTTATTTKIVTGSASKKVYVTSFRLHAGGTTTAKFVEGTGTNCGTGTADLSETFDFAASDGSNQGNGLGPVLVAATAGDDICVLNGSAANLRVGVAYEIH